MKEALVPKQPCKVQLLAFPSYRQLQGSAEAQDPLL